VLVGLDVLLLLPLLLQGQQGAAAALPWVWLPYVAP
jgi:hypothetical protein